MIQLYYLTSILLLSCPRHVPSDTSNVGICIRGNWIGNNQQITATAIKLKEGVGNPVEGGESDEWAVQFSAKEIKPLSIGCCEAVLINEGDLDLNGTEEISIYQTPSSGCTYLFTTYSFKNGSWKIIAGPILIPSSCDGWKEEDLKNRVVREGKDIFIYEGDFNDEKDSLIKKKVE